MPFICLNDKSYKRIERYAETAGISIELAASRAIDEWMNTTGDDVVYILKQRRKKQAAKRKAAPITIPLSPSPIFLLPTQENRISAR